MAATALRAPSERSVAVRLAARALPPRRPRETAAVFLGIDGLAHIVMSDLIQPVITLAVRSRIGLDGFARKRGVIQTAESAFAGVPAARLEPLVEVEGV